MSTDQSTQQASLTPDQLADKCEVWLQAGGASNVVDAYEAGYRAAQSAAAPLPEADHSVDANKMVPEAAPALTDERIDAITVAQWGKQIGSMLQAHRAYARAVLAALPLQAAPSLISDQQYIDMFMAAMNGSNKPSGYLRGIRRVIAAYEAAAVPLQAAQAEPSVCSALAAPAPTGQAARTQPAPPAPQCEALLLWALWHHQGASSPVGQPIRRALGIGPREALTVGQVHAATDAVTRLMGDSTPPKERT